VAKRATRVEGEGSPLSRRTCSLCRSPKDGDIALLEQRAQALEAEIVTRKALEVALLESLAREQAARATAEASDAFKEVFLGVLGHDLLNPLNTVLTTARLMTLRGEVPAASEARLRRIVSSGERMERMVSQIIDVTRARLAGGIAVACSVQDLVPVVEEIVDELRVANPHRTIAVRAPGPCLAMLDPDRIAQVISNLVSNALTHGDSDRPVEIAIELESPDHVSLRVHNHGPAIDSSSLGSLFDPFERKRPAGRSDALGLGLYICERIVAAHRGAISVQSADLTGTCFAVLLPTQ
jgi:signal transduction histidine kinase